MQNENIDTRSVKHTSLRNNILIAFFLVLAFTGSAINIIFLNTINTTLTYQGLEHDIIDHISRQLTIMSTGGSIAFILISLLMAFLISKAITWPIRKMTDGMEDITMGKWDTTINLTSHDEIGDLANGFNFMSKHIKETMDELSAAKEYTDNIIASVPSMLIVIDSGLNIISTNMTVTQYPEMRLEDFIESLEDEIYQNLKTGETVRKDMVIVPSGGSNRLIFSAVVSRIRSLKDQNMEEASVLLTITDITESEKMRELVHQSRQDWEDTFNVIPDMITIHDRDYNVIHANEAAREILNLPSFDLKKASNCYNFFYGNDSAQEKCKGKNCIKNRSQCNVEYYEPELNKYLEIRSIPRINVNNEVIGIIHMVRDISERKGIENNHANLLEAITKAKVEWEITFDSVTEFVVLLDKNLTITRCNKSFSEFTGRETAEIIGSKYYEYFPGLSKDLEGGDNDHHYTKEEILTESGRWLYVSLRPIKEHKDAAFHSVIVATDITNLKKTQEKLEGSKKELREKIDDLEKFYNMSIGRELKMKELKDEIKYLNSEMEALKDRNNISEHDLVKE